MRPSSEPHLPLRRVASVAIGNALEFYDFLTFSFFAVQIGHSFFPVTKTSHGLLFTLATFGVGFLARPLGGVVLGRYADRAGRKPAMVLSFTLMGVGITCLALTPGYATLGIAAPILLVLFRLVQGFALGGELGSSTAFLIEAAPAHRRGLYLSLQASTQYLAVLAAGLIGFILAAILSPAVLDEWGWRAAFLAGATVVPFGVAMRMNLTETLQTAESTASPPALTAKLVILSLLMLGAGTIGTYSLDYMAVYAQDTLGMPASLAFGATVVSGVIGIMACIAAGFLADRFGRKRVMLIAVCCQIVLVLPAFIAINVTRSALVMYVATAIVCMAQNCTDVPVLLLITESLPKSIRAGALAVIYAVAIAVFGGSTQFVVKALIDYTGNPLAPAWFMTGALLVGACAMLGMREIVPGFVVGQKRGRGRASNAAPFMPPDPARAPGSPADYVASPE